MSELISLLRNKLDMSSALVVPLQDQAIMIACYLVECVDALSILERPHDVITPHRYSIPQYRTDIVTQMVFNGVLFIQSLPARARHYVVIKRQRAAK